MFKVSQLVATSILLASAVSMSGCGKSQHPAEVVSMAEISKSTLEQVASKRVLFAHQSVGRDLLEGVSELAERNGVPISVVETRVPPESGSGIFHFRVGKNRDPQGKIKDYLSAFEGIGAHGADIAIMKLCYVDFNRDTDPNALAQEYVGAIKSLQAKHPQTRFVAMTSPLTTVQTGPKAMLKKLVGKSPEGYVENALRQQFNDQLRKEFQPGHLFDIAALEANAVKSEPLVIDGKTIQTLPEALTYDGGHLNDESNRVIAASFLKFISEQPTNEQLSGT